MTYEDQIHEVLTLEWVTPDQVSEKTGIPAMYVNYTLKKLTDDGRAVYESRGGRVRRAPDKPDPLEFDVEAEVVAFLDEQYEPVGPKEIAKAIGVGVRSLKTDLAKMREDGIVICVQEEGSVDGEFVPSLWVSA